MVHPVLNNSRFHRKMQFLLENQHLARRQLPPSPAYPCCFGTVVYLVEARKRVQALWSATGHRLDDFCDGMGNYVCIPDNNGPGYLGDQPMELLLNTYLPGTKKKDEIMAFYWDSPGSELLGFALRHAAIYLGQHEGREYMFEQIEERAPFQITTIDAFKSSLGEKSQKSLEIKFYSED